LFIVPTIYVVVARSHKAGGAEEISAEAVAA